MSVDQNEFNELKARVGVIESKLLDHAAKLTHLEQMVQNLGMRIDQLNRMFLDPPTPSQAPLIERLATAVELMERFKFMGSTIFKIVISIAGLITAITVITNLGV